MYIVDVSSTSLDLRDKSEPYQNEVDINLY